MTPPLALGPIGTAGRNPVTEPSALQFQRAAVPRLGVRLGLEFLCEGQHPLADDVVYHAPSQSARPSGGFPLGSNFSELVHLRHSGNHPTLFAEMGFQKKHAEQSTAS